MHDASLCSERHQAVDSQFCRLFDQRSHPIPLGNRRRQNHLRPISGWVLLELVDSQFNLATARTDNLGPGPHALAIEEFNGIPRA